MIFTLKGLKTLMIISSVTLKYDHLITMVCRLAVMDEIIESDLTHLFEGHLILPSRESLDHISI